MIMSQKWERERERLHIHIQNTDRAGTSIPGVK